ncbi:hypothetical protein L1049_027287 [Liquidambar formosana]|uniref:Protein NO VEIN C-terminal domain-containing protein n=1 Tax=Liquidambar formosana TaxID=63359 RepID=A0AAP0R2P4_LIQFO
MLSDLNSWSHWDLIFAPSLGPLVGWLLNEVNTKEFLCLVTKDGKVVRINPLATLDSFLEVSLQGSSFQTAVELISLFSLLGGKRHVPLSLLKCHARQAFEVILKNSMENVEVSDVQNLLMHGKAVCRERKLDEDTSSNLGNELHKNVGTDKALPVASRFFLDCLCYLPSEFRSFAADVLLSGLQYVIKDAPSAILCECNQTEQHIMLHEVGLSLGIMEWIDDYHAFCSTAATDLLNFSGTSHLKAASSGISTNLKYAQDAMDKLPSSEDEMRVSVEADGHNKECSEVCHAIDCVEVTVNRFGNGCMQHVSQLNEYKDAALVIESIRREEFGLDPNLPNMESRMLKKQHARLGRALHCLSQELYSQDSHFLLELVQNADDNIYPENVEPTLTFILQEAGIIVLNNERGFSPQNIRALCDVGNSTKKGSGAGYIGQKGIGFKSVFRVTDAPEIHSNGFHVKFDISEGQIGFVLPTTVPPCDIDLFRRLASGDTDQLDANCWNTCIVLPFRLKLSEATAMKNIMSMFSDLHPSLLLFLHRLQCIKFRNMLNNSFLVMRKEIVGNGIITVSHGKEKMSWLVVSQKLQADVIRADVQTTEIAIAFTLQESGKGDYNPHLDLQPVFAFLPLRTYGLKFILQGDFILPSSREEVDGDSPWNQWLLSEFPGLFVSAERSFCDLPCFRENPGKGVAAYMSFVPLVGEVHGFFSSLPRMIISKLRMSNCLLLEGDNNTWVPPFKVLRSWNEQARIVLPDSLLLEHLGLGFLDKDIILSDPLARALGIEEYGPKILLQIISSLCCKENGLKSAGLGWLFYCLNELYTLSFHSSGQSSLNPGMELDLINNLRKIPFIPLSDGMYGSVDDGAIWLHSDALSTGFDGEHGLETFPNLYANLRTVSPALLSAAAVSTEMAVIDNVTRMLHKIGVQQLSAHDIIKVHILPAISDDRITKRGKNLITEYISFVMLHLQSSCVNCRVEREYIVSELRNKALILTSRGYKRLIEVPIHFSKEYGNPIDVNKLIDALDFEWHEVDITYLKHPITESLSCGLLKWREFFQELGVTDFVQIVQVEKSIIDISHSLLKNMIWDSELISLGSIAKDWESHELSHLLTLLSLNGNREKCKYLLEVLDTLWDDCFSEKVTGYCNFKSSGDSKPFKSSFISSICDVRWIVSSVDDELHYPNNLFYDCDAVHSVLGASAPYAVPKVKSGKLLSDIGFKTQVVLDDILAILQLWRRLKTPFRASIAQMSRFYTFIWNEMATSRQKIVEEFHSGPFIFVPCASVSKHEDLVPGILLSADEVYWNDSTGCMDQMKVINPQCDAIGGIYGPLSKTLCSVYPGLRDFFVNGCGVHEIPPFRSYLHILLQFSTVALPCQAANAVFRIFLKWTDALKSGLVTSEDIVYLKESLLKLEFTVLPTVQDRWVSLHPSFGLVCWCDDEKLRNEFKHSDNMDFLYFGELSNDEKEMLRTNISVFLQTFGIPALSEVVTREAIYYGLADSSFKNALVDWALPYAQRYIYNIHPDKYFQFKQSGFEILNHLRIVVVEKLFYRNVIKRCDIASKKRFECNSLQQGNILYTTQESDSHSLFMELSCLLFDGTPELHLANFLHMITTMVESGSTEEQMEFFILNSQKVPKLPNEESAWSLSSVPSATESEETLQTSALPIFNEQNPLKSKRKSGINSNWPPVDWKTAPGFRFARANGFRTQAVDPQPSSSSQKQQEKNSDGIVAQKDPVVPIEINADWTIEDDSAASKEALIFPDSEALENQSNHACNPADFIVNVAFDPIDLNSVSESLELASCKFSMRTKLNVGTPNATQALLTGRLGELVACKYFVGKVGKTVVKWVNEDNETGLPYDILITEEGKGTEYIEVKTTKSARKDWFIISTREWQFAVDKGESFSVARVILSGNNVARIAIFKNPARLCQQGKLQLVVMMPKQQKEFSVVS